MTNPQDESAPQRKPRGEVFQDPNEVITYQKTALATSQTEGNFMDETPNLPLFAWCAPPRVIPFPLVRRRAFIRKTATSMITRGLELGARDPVATGEKLLSATLRRQREVMQRRGIDNEVIEAELSALECAVRVEHARLQASGAVA